MAFLRGEVDQGCCEELGVSLDRETTLTRGFSNVLRHPSINMRDLALTIETAVIPRMLLTHRTEEAPSRAIAQRRKEVRSAHVDELAKLLLDHDSSLASEFVDAYVRDGTPLDVVLLELLAPAARLLGEMWEADLCGFVEVTLGLSRMQHMLRRYGRGAEPDEAGMGRGHCVLLVPTPGEQHTFGLRLIEEFLLRDGWDVRCNLMSSRAETISTVSSGFFDVVGFTLSGEMLMASLMSTIVDVRRASRNRGIRVMVGGFIFVEHPEFLQQVGADAIARDAYDAVRLARQWSREAYLS